ncbi:MAG: hypothetical protein Q8Q80_07885 [Methyloversatilis sp.]|uniref:hypothetical protein n=1 Tax=Methyloversatilis sp. TaxID=2569862 RepID=UPI002737256D|nr:hypothetical protein [Methyloversatilis sp.]MDP3872568.1 hypothetical protein [Methyloversatilis sp.]
MKGALADIRRSLRRRSASRPLLSISTSACWRDGSTWLIRQRRHEASIAARNPALEEYSSPLRNFSHAPLICLLSFGLDNQLL